MKTIRKKPWNRVDQPVYSIASTSAGKHNMNICTYATPVSMQPKRYVVAIYKNTFTEKIVKENPEFVLQFLAESHCTFIPLLGKKSGFTINKLKKLKKTISFNQFILLPDLIACVHLKVIAWIDGGDHDCAICDVVQYKNLNDAKPLTLDYLRNKKMIRG